MSKGTRSVPAGLTEIVGADAFFLNVDDDRTPGHTLKVVTLDPSRRHTPLTAQDLVDLAPAYLALSPRFTQRVRSIGRRRYWEEAPSFDVASHVEEHVLDTGSTAELESLCAELATRRLPLNRPLWALTLVHGLEGGLQAAVLRIHHGIMDGLASINLLKALTTDVPATLPPTPVAEQETSTARAPLTHRVRDLIHAGFDSRAKSKAFGPTKYIPTGLGPRTIFNRRSGAARLCASHSMPFDDLKLLSILGGTTVNGALHAVIAHAMRGELHDQGIRSTEPLIATFGVVADGTSNRCHGNDVATARVWLHADQLSPSRLLALTAASCQQAVALRRHRGFDLHKHAMEVIDKLAPLFRALAADRTPLVTNHITTANVPGPQATRWFGNVRVVGLTSYSLAIAPADVSLTAYSYAGRMWFGLVTTPESMPAPNSFLRRFDDALADLLGAVQPHVTDEARTLAVRSAAERAMS